MNTERNDEVEKMAAAQLIRAMNVILGARRARYRVALDFLVESRKDGYTLLALKETKDAPDYSGVRPYSDTLEMREVP